MGTLILCRYLSYQFFHNPSCCLTQNSVDDNEGTTCSNRQVLLLRDDNTEGSRGSLFGCCEHFSGTHLLEVSALGHYFSSVRVDVSAWHHGQVGALAVESSRYYRGALILEVLKEEVYYEKREPFPAMSLLKSPMGVMVGFMMVAMVLLPRLMDSIDPEEMKRVQEEMRNQPAPSFSRLLQGGRS